VTRPDEGSIASKRCSALVVHTRTLVPSARPSRRAASRSPRSATNAGDIVPTATTAPRALPAVHHSRAIPTISS